MLDIFDEFRNVVAVLNDHEIDYALCGGMAMAVHKRARMTIDIDILIQPESLDRIVSIMTGFGFNIRGKDLSFAQQSSRGRKEKWIR
jgi:hypothetical protein